MITLALLGNLASGDGLIIFVVILLLFGAKKLPELARGLGSAVREFSKAKDEIEHEITRPPTQSASQLPPRQEDPYRVTHEYTPEMQAADDEYHRRQSMTEEQQHQAQPATTAPAVASAPTPATGTVPAAGTVPVGGAQPHSGHSA